MVTNTQYILYTSNLTHLKAHVDLRLSRNNICIKYRRHMKMQYDITNTSTTVG